MLDAVDATAAQIVLAASDGDSIRRVAQKIDGTYSWVYTWVERLEAIGVVERADGVRVTAPAVRDAYAAVLAALARQSPPTVEEAYVLPHFADRPFAYTELDAVHVWTHGGYQIARDTEAYPVFLRVEDADVDRWRSFFERYGVPTVVDGRDDAVLEETAGSVYYCLFPTTDPIDPAWVEGDPVLPLAETVAYMRTRRPSFEPALAILADEHDIDIETDHSAYAPEG